MSDATDTGGSGAGEPPSIGSIAWRLARYVLPGAVAVMVVWEVFSELLEGRLPAGRIVWAAVVLLVVLAVAVAALRKHVASRE